MISFTENGITIGEPPADAPLQNTIYDFLRLAGRKYSDPSFQKDSRFWPFTITQGSNDRPEIAVFHNHETHTYQIEEVIALLVSHLYEQAKSSFKIAIKNVILSIPNFSNYHQKQALINACSIAGLKVLRVIRDATAIALSLQTEKNILIYNLEAGTLSISLVYMKKEVYEVKATEGDNHLGGVDFENTLIEYFCNEFYKQSGYDIRQNHIDFRELRNLLKHVKDWTNQSQKQIQFKTSTNVIFNMIMTKQIFEELCNELLERCMVPANLLNQIEEIQIYGGASRIVQEMFKKYGKKLNLCYNNEDAVTYGAALYSAKLKGAEGIRLIDCMPFSLGVEIQGQLIIVLPKGSAIPIKNTNSLHFNQEQVVQLNICEDKYQFGTISFEMPHNSREVLITFIMNEDSTLEINISNSETKQLIPVLFVKDKSILSENDIQNLINKSGNEYHNRKKVKI